MQEALFQVIIVYLIFAVVVTALFGIIRKTSKNKSFVFIFILILISPSFLYIPVELNTYLYGKEFQDVEIETGYESEVIYYKVFSIDD